MSTAVITCLLVATLGLPSMADTEADPPPKKDRRGLLLRLEWMQREGGGGPWVAMERAVGPGKTAEFEDAAGFRVGAELELGLGVWLEASVARSTPTLEITTHDSDGVPDIVQRASVSMTPWLVGFEFRSKEWRDRRVLGGLGIHYGWVRYGSLPPGIEMELESTETAFGFDGRLDFRLGKTPWWAGVELGALFSSPGITDLETGNTCSAHFDGALWAVGFTRQF